MNHQSFNSDLMLDELNDRSEFDKSQNNNDQEINQLKNQV